MKHFVPTLCLIGALILIAGCTAHAPLPTDRTVSPGVAINQISYHNEYGIASDSLWRFRGRIRYGETLSDILARANVSRQTIHQLVQASSDVFNPRALRAGDSYRLFTSTTDEPVGRYLVYEPDPTNYVVFDIQAPRVWRGQHPTTTSIETAAGVVETSLWETLQENDLPAGLALELSEVFAWEIDFYRIQRGDRFKVIYSREYVHGQPIGIGQIRGAFFEHSDEEFYAVHYNQGNGGDFFDREGNSLRKQFLKAPLEYRRISSRYTRRRYHPVLKTYRAHLGTDYAAAPGTPIRTVGDGTVVAAHYDSGNGRFVKVRHNGTYTTQYLHMSRIASGISRGTEVKQGQVIGYVGSTGLATGPHLCYRFWKNGRQVDPYEVEIPPSEPIDPAHEESYEQQKERIVAALDTIDFPSAPRSDEQLASRNRAEKNQISPTEGG